jgi:hypothetical protein
MILKVKSREPARECEKIGQKSGREFGSKLGNNEMQQTKWERDRDREESGRRWRDLNGRQGDGMVWHLGQG